MVAKDSKFSWEEFTLAADKKLSLIFNVIISLDSLNIYLESSFT